MPARLVIDPNSQNTSKYFKHWSKTSTHRFLRKDIGYWPHYVNEGFAAPNNLEVLCAYVSCEVYELIKGCDFYDVAIAKFRKTATNTTPAKDSSVFREDQVSDDDSRVGLYVLYLKLFSVDLFEPTKQFFWLTRT